MQPSFLRTDEQKDALCSLQLVSEQLPKVLDNPLNWKWVIIALHNALQGFMVLALKGSDSLNVLSKDSCVEWLAAYDNPDSSLPRLKIDDFMRLYKKIKMGRGTYDKEILKESAVPRKQSDLMLMYSGSVPFKPIGTQSDSVKLLHHLRNDFMHFLPKGWSIDLSGLPKMVNDCVDIIEFLAFECHNVVWNSADLQTEIRQLLDKIRLAGEALRAVRET